VHLLAVFVPGKVKFAVGGKRPRAAILVRTSAGDDLRVSGTDALTTAGRPTRWSDRVLDDKLWKPVVADPGSGAPFPSSGAFLLRRAFEVRKPFRVVRLYMTALGAYVPMMNGHRVGDKIMAPEWTDFRRHVLYRAYDVTDLLRQGHNTLGAIVGDGWYGSYMAPNGRFGFGGAPLRLRAQLVIEYADGTQDTVATDEQWSVSPSCVTSSEIYDGETVDARLDQPDWVEPERSADDARWQPANAVRTPLITLLGATLPPISPSMTLKPVSLKRQSDGSVVADFGQNFAGWVSLRMRGRSGQQVRIRYAELLGNDGSVDQSNLRAAKSTDTYIMRGAPEGEVFEPLFTYHGFRYVQLEGLETPLIADDLEGVVVHSQLPEIGQLTLSQHVPQRLWENALWSQRSNFFGTSYSNGG
ncbi:MAG: alpha-L-rhamnosidase, partial [Oxalobacteraceae bacterium]